MTSSGVAHFFSRMNLAGGELRTVEVVEATGLTFDFIALAGTQGALDERLRAGGHGVVPFRLSLRAIPRLFRFLRERRYRVVHVHLGAASGPVIALAALAGIRTRIAHFRSDAVGGTASLRRSVALALSMAMIRLWATRIVGVAPASLRGAFGARWENDPRFAVLPNGIDARRVRAAAATERARRPDVEERIVVVNVGRVEPSKNRGRSVLVWEALAARQPSTLLLVGEVNAADLRLVAEVRDRLSPGSSIEVVGDVPDIAEYLGRAHVLVVTSRREGLPGVVLEALAAGTPVVSSDLPGAVWIAESIDGVTILALDEPNEHWAEALLAAARTPAELVTSSFDAGPFELVRVVPRFEELWGIVR